MGILLPLLALLLILVALAIFIGMYLNNDHKDKDGTKQENTTEQTSNKSDKKIMIKIKLLKIIKLTNQVKNLQ